MNYCMRFNMPCATANEHGHCSVTACTRYMSTSTINTSPRPDARQDGMYIEVFVVKDGIRYNSKIINVRDLSTILTGSLMDGIEKILK